MTSSNTTPPAAAPQAEGLPMFYKTPRPLDKSRDLNLKISRPTHFNFTRGTNAIPLLADEFPLAAAYYPIVFAAGPTPVPAAVVGLRNDENLYLNAQGQWANGAYLPAYIRRYPFILMDDAENKQFVLCLDESSDMLATTGEYALFENGEPTEFTKNAMEFCAALRQQGDATDAFIAALKEYDLLMPNDAQIDLRDGSRLQLSGFLTINPQKFDELPDNVYLAWRKKGWIGLIYAQLLSSHRWQNLVDMMQVSNTAQGKGA